MATPLATARAASSASASTTPAATASTDQALPTMTKSISTITPPAVPKCRGQTQGRSVVLRRITPAISGTSSGERLRRRALVTARPIRPSSSSTEFSSERSSLRITVATPRPSTQAISTEPPKV